MNRDKNSYTVIYASVMVILVAVLLAFVSQTLSDKQNDNEKIDKMQQILRSVNMATEDKGKVISTYMSVIKQELLINQDGTVAQTFEGDQLAQNEAFKMNTRNAFKLAADDKSIALPLYVAEVDGQTKYIVPMNGAGLWGPIWGFVALTTAMDLNSPPLKISFPWNCPENCEVVISAPNPGVSPWWPKSVPKIVLQSSFNATKPQIGPHSPAPFIGTMYLVCPSTSAT